MINHINKITPLFKSDNIDLFTKRHNNDEISMLINLEKNCLKQSKTIRIFF